MVKNIDFTIFVFVRSFLDLLVHLFDCSFVHLFVCLRSSGRLVFSSFARLVVCSGGRFLIWSFRLLVVCSFARMFV